MLRGIRLYLWGLCLGIVTLWAGCNSKGHGEEISKVTAVITEVENEFAPDKRVAIFDVQVENHGDQLLLKGSTNLPKAIETFKEKLEGLQLDLIDSIEQLPASDLKGKTQGIIVLSVANLRGNPRHSAELVTQGTLGTPVKIYKKQGSWYLIQTPDKYIAWVDLGGVVAMDSTQFDQWVDSDKLIYTNTFGSSYLESDASKQVVADLVAGNILKLLGDEGEFYKVEYPDSRVAYVSKTEAQPYNQWLESLAQTKQSLVETSRTLMGLPYLWGGTSAKGVDCSGFTKTVFFLNGLIIPRDASQQIHEGMLVDQNKDFSKLLAGDLLFFGKKATDTTKERITHVGMWIGNNEFIHSAGSVHISSVDENSPNYDPYNLNRYIRAKRLLKEDSKGIIDLKETELF